MGIEDEIEKIEEFERAWKVLPDELISTLPPGLSPENIIRLVVVRCFDLHTTQMAEFATMEHTDDF